MAEKKSILLLLPTLQLSGSSDTLNALKKKAAILPNANTAGLEDLAAGLEGKTVDSAALAGAEDVLLVVHGDESALAAALEAADRRTLIVVAAADGVAFSGLAINGKAGSVDRKVSAQDIAVTIATITDLPVSGNCTGATIYQVMKNPNLKLDEIKKLKEALMRMESVIQRDNREPWDKHDCA
ncbi:MAG: hypothetical protein RBR41_04765 [Desulfovibrio sp.]|uniref:hypothetical protein n=1 Tax=Desulfovibrio sp. TaxID=885 RepID=UPI002A3628C7|nr:hypothetical protein [Desulfovibrio sp.]MDY0258961.1 hypothetical protein [Desulfovibrio sp.]